VTSDTKVVGKARGKVTRKGGELRVGSDGRLREQLGEIQFIVCVIISMEFGDRTEH